MSSEVHPIEELQVEVVIIGGGPAGASAAAMLGGAGRNVLVLEREKFPRYHIGESLLPFTFYPLKQLGLLERMKTSAFVKKYSVQFVAPSGKASQPFYFSTRYPEEVAQTWQVLRAEFDEMLLNHARQRGAKVMEETEVLDLLRQDGKVVGVRARRADGREFLVRSKMVLDASGKESFTAVKNQWRVKDPKLNKVAVWTYYRGAKRDEGIDAGATTVAFVPDKGWFWYIPLHDDMVSVGVVAEGKYLSRDGVRDPKQMFHREVENNLWIKRYLAEGEQTGRYFITNEYSFHSRHCGSEGLVLMGDAFCFLDPVFSSGLMLALKSGVMAGEMVAEGLAENDLRPERFESYARYMREGVENMRKLVYAFYNPNFSFRTFTDKYPGLAGDITDCLSGDVNKDFTALFTAISEFAEVPEALPYGMPLSSSHPVAA
jgi:flavin-dependent dehydrogenase